MNADDLQIGKWYTGTNSNDYNILEFKGLNGDYMYVFAAYTGTSPEFPGDYVKEVITDHAYVTLLSEVL